MTGTKRKRISKKILIPLGIAVSLICLYLAFRRINFPKLWLEMKKMDGWAILGALLLANFHNFLMAFRWKFLLSHLGKVTFWNAFWSLRISFFFNATLPARLGEPFRVWYLNRLHHISSARIVGAMGAERFVDFIMLASLVYVSALVLGIRGTLPTDETILSASLSIVAIFIVLAKLPKTSRIRWLQGLLSLRARIFEGIASLRKPRILLVAVPVSILGWLTEALILVTFSHGLDAQMSIFRALMVVAAVNIAIAIPSTPGNIGTFQLGAIAMLVYLDIPKAQAATLAILYHLIQLIPTVLIGAYGYYFYFMKMPKAAAIAPHLEEKLEDLQEKLTEQLDRASQS